MQFSCIHNFILLVQNQTIFAVKMTSAFSTTKSKFQLNSARRFQNMNSQNLAQLHFYFYSFCYGVKVTQMGYPIVLKFGTQKGGVRAHLDNKFGQNTINTRKDNLRLFMKNNTNMLSRTQQQEAVNFYKGRLTIEPQTFCGLKEIELKRL